MAMFTVVASSREKKCAARVLLPRRVRRHLSGVQLSSDFEVYWHRIEWCEAQLMDEM